VTPPPIASLTKREDAVTWADGWGIDLGLPLTAVSLLVLYRASRFGTGIIDNRDGFGGWE